MQILLFSQMSLQQVWKRLVAQIIDLALAFLITIVLVGLSGIKIKTAAPFYWIYFSIFLAYSMLLDAYYNGTIGKLMLGLKVVQTPRLRSNLLTAFYRNLMKSSMIFFIGGLILLIVGRQGFHNKITQCVVQEGPIKN